MAAAGGAGTSKERMKSPAKQDGKKFDPFSFDESEDATAFEAEEKAKPKIVVVPQKARLVLSFCPLLSL